MSTQLRKNTKKYLKKYFFKLLNNVVFGETMETITIEARRSCFQSEPNYATTKTFFSRFICNRNEKKQNKTKQKKNRDPHELICLFRSTNAGNK